MPMTEEELLEAEAREVTDFRKKWGNIAREKLEALHREYGQIWVLNVNDPSDPVVVFKKPSRLEYKEFQAKVADNTKYLPIANERFAKAIVVYPDETAFDALLDEWPALADKVGAEGRRVAAKEATEHSKKFELPPSK